MIVTSGFIGNAKDFVWIIPTPAKPEITKASEKVFENAAKLAQPVYGNRGIGGIELMAAGGAKAGIGVEVIESKKVDYYDVTVLSATSSDDLVRWFNANDYSYSQEFEYVLRYYVKKGWYFTAIKVSPETQGAREVTMDLQEGHPTPVKMVFSSKDIVFPLKISSVDFKPESEEGIYYRYGSYVPIQLYVIADGKYQADMFNIQYGNWVKKSEIEGLGDDENGEPFIRPEGRKYYLTSLYSSYSKSLMDEDIVLKSAPDNKKVNAGPETWQIFLYGLGIGMLLLIAWTLCPLGIMFVIGALILFLSSNRAARIFGWIIEIFSLAATLIIGVIFFSMTAMNNSLGNYVVVSFLITCLVIVCLCVLLITLELRYKKAERRA
jgi:hypothetical protein